MQSTTPEHPFFTLERGWMVSEDVWLGAPLCCNARVELVAPEASNRARALKVLRSALDLSIAEAAALRNRIPGPVMVGTEHEMRRLHHLLAAEQVPSEIVHRAEIEGEYA